MKCLVRNGPRTLQTPDLAFWLTFLFVLVAAEGIPRAAHEVAEQGDDGEMLQDTHRRLKLNRGKLHAVVLTRKDLARGWAERASQPV